MLVIAPSEYDFGLVHTENSNSNSNSNNNNSNNRNTVTLFISNPTEVDACWQLRHIPAVVRKRSIIAKSTTTTTATTTTATQSEAEDDPDVFVFGEECGVMSGPSVMLGSSGAVLPMDLNRFSDAVFPQSLTQLTWKTAPTATATATAAAPTTTATATATTTSSAAATDLMKATHCDINELLQQRNTDNAHMARPLTVSFRPKHKGNYCSRFRLDVTAVEGCDIVLRGTGTYEENTTANAPARVFATLGVNVAF